MPIRFVPNTPAPTHPGRFLATEQYGLTGRPGGPLLTDVFPAGWGVLRAAFGADPAADPSTWTWTDITRRALWDDELDIKIGYSNESKRISSASLTAKLRNDQAGGGDFTVDNAYGAYWPNVVENVPIWAQLDIGNGECDIFQGYATSWAPTWASGNRDATVTLLANGVHRRIKQGSDTERSAIRRLFDAADPPPVAYWPGEDDTDATVPASGLPGGTPLVVQGGGSASSGIVFGARQGRLQLPSTGWEVPRVGVKSWISLAGGASLSAALPSGTATAWRVQFAGFAWADPTDVVLCRVYCQAGGPFTRYDLKLRGADGLLELVGFNGTAATSMIVTAFAPIDEAEYVIIQDQVGGNVVTSAGWFQTIQHFDLIEFYTHSIAGTVKLPTSVTWNPDRYVSNGTPIPGSENLLTDFRLSHMAVWHGSTLRYMTESAVSSITGTYYSAWTGWIGESATDRLQRLANEEGTRVDIVGTSNAAMEFQGVGTFEDLLMEPAAADLGVLVDGLGWGYTYFTHDSIASQGAALVLDSTGAPGGDVLGPNAAVHDDLERVTDYTAKIPDGTSARFAAAGGLTYRDSGEHSLFYVDDLAQIPAWEVGRGALTGLRWPQLRFQLAKGTTSTKAQAWLNCRPGSRIDARGISQGSRPDRSLMLLGWRLRMNSKIAEVTANLVGYEPYATTLLAADSGDVGEFASWLDVDQVTVMTDVPAGGTSVVCAVIGPAMTYPAVTTYADDLVGLYINLDGLRVGVTGISAPDAAGWQTISVTGADVVRAVRAGAQVTAWDPVTLAL